MTKVYIAQNSRNYVIGVFSSKARAQKMALDYLGKGAELVFKGKSLEEYSGQEDYVKITYENLNSNYYEAY